MKVYDGATLLGTVTANGSGTWAEPTLTDGSHSLTATDLDANGNASTASSAVNVKVDTHAPSVPTLTSYSSSTQLLSGTAEANSVIKIYDGGTLLGTSAANASGAWSFLTGSLASGSHSLTATDMDAAGNTSAASSALAVTGTASAAAPGAPTIAGFFGDSGVLGDGITDANVLTLTGTALVNQHGKALRRHDAARHDHGRRLRPLELQDLQRCPTAPTCSPRPRPMRPAIPAYNLPSCRCRWCRA